ncbi:Oxygen-dependent choline dehydrogenase [Apiospora arundinis]|uniref:Oxygen-dependent choline dehydrogenase n=1 Tax=Apiospora arundinis TaxID=335852 RepID=A0ABR2IFL2_9PEZI
MLPGLFGALVLAATAAVAQNSSASYDYIVVGSGAAGAPLAANLARGGHSVLLLEAGDDQANNPNISTLRNFNLATNDEKTRWDFWTKHSEDPERELKYLHMVWRKTDGSFYVGIDPPEGAKQLGIWYPRAGTLGGCAMHNAGVCALPADADWDIIVNKTGDKSWSAENMRKYWNKMEKNEYLPKGTPGHGFDGWLSTNTGDTAWASGSNDLKIMAQQLAEATGGNRTNIANLVQKDMNALDPNRDHDTGVFSLASHGDKQGMRTGTNTYLKATLADAAKYPLTIQLETLVTKVLFDEKAKEPTAIGVEYLEGRSLYSADPRYDPKVQGKPGRAYAKKEVILSGGAFNTPQLLKLSGIGPAAELRQFAISLVKDLPGVGERVADNYENNLLALASKPINASAGPISVMLQTPSAANNSYGRNIYAWCNSFAFEGYWPGYPNDYGANEYECAFAHMNPKSQAGYVRLRSADPRDTPEINLRFYETGADEDLTEQLDAIKTFRQAFNSAPSPLTPFTELHPCPGAANEKCSDADQKEYLKLQSHSHHVTSGCAIGGDGDAMAVLDSQFRVRGVRRLRVVDGSAFPVVPGAFPVCPTMMLGEKAAEDILAAAAA